MMSIHRTLIVCVAGLLASAGTGVFADDLYSQQSFDALVADHRALRPGDNLTVIVTEITTATSDARTSTDKSLAVSGTASLHNRSQQGAFNIADTYSGGGTTERSDKLTARLTVVVQAVDSDGYLRVKGQQEIVVNGERQRLLVEGRVRPIDIGTDNTLLSSRLSDAKISYTGKGALNDAQRPGLLARLLGFLRIL
jgi:flagellar L-ring protein precursor FlgH